MSLCSNICFKQCSTGSIV